MTTIGVVHATPMSLTALVGPLARWLPGAAVRNVLDDSLLVELQQHGCVTPALERRLERLVTYLLSEPVDALQFACSGFAPVVDRLSTALDIPVRTPDGALYRQLADGPMRRIGLVATVPTALDSAERRLRALLADRGGPTAVWTVAVPEALPMAQAGDQSALAATLAAAIRPWREDGVEGVAFVQYSLAPVADSVSQRTGLAVATGPDAAARDLAMALARPGHGDSEHASTVPEEQDPT